MSNTWTLKDYNPQANQPDCSMVVNENGNLVCWPEAFDEGELGIIFNSHWEAYLISAAPELFQALEILVRQYEESPDCILGGKLTNEGFLLGKKALLKAKGRAE